ncbi:MAG: phenylalanine--tRNA ligase subunit alpha [Candidatus Dadabacteria bacterium]|nr:phenylalanine--tRNA ligase subunit alpha [Candidatus Dadabacteria bacterium]
MQEALEQIRNQIGSDLEGVSTEADLVRVKAGYVGKKGSLTQLLKSMKDLPASERRQAGILINRTKKEVEELIERKSDEIKRRAMDEKLLEEATDFTLPGRGMPVGAKHPITQVMERIVYDFERMGFEVAEGPEVELDYYNFEALNIPKNHPARDMQDTFYITDDMVLRTHTSPVQIRIMQTQQPPVKIIAPGKVYRCDSDVSHTPMFHQIEGLLVDKGITFGNLKSVIIQFVKLTFGDDTNVRFRPSFFPFTEPSAEVDIECQICSGNGCRVCKGTGWLEIMGCGMVDPAVFSSVNYNTDIYSGFAFGMGVERIAMLKYGINDIRLFFENDVRFLRQFV